MKIRCAMEDARIENRVDGSEKAEGRVHLMKIRCGTEDIGAAVKSMTPNLL
jgi:hypothetical protein